MMKNKSTLAKLLAEEDVFVVHKQMETAYFDSKKRELGLPIWKDEEMTDDIYDLMVCHEIGHALWTPLDMLEKAAVRKINHSFVNILEDARIEKMVKGKYPGAIGVFNRGYVDLLKKDFFGTAKKDLSKLNFIDRINLFYKAGAAYTTLEGMDFSDEEWSWIKRIDAMKTPDDVLDLAEELYKWMEENESETDNHNSGEESEMGMPSMGMPGKGEGESDNSDGENGNDDNAGNKSGSGNSDDSDDAEDGEGSSSGKGEKVDDEISDDSGSSVGDSDSSESDDTKDTSVDDNKDSSSEIGGVSTTGSGGVPEATTDSAFGKAMDELRDKVAEDRVYANIPKLPLDKIIVSHKVVGDLFKNHYLKEKSEDRSGLYWNKTFEELEILKNDSKKTVAYMVKEFEMKKAADQYARAATSKTGTLDMSKLHTYKYNDDLFKKVTTLPGATNHGMVLVLDWSGSMVDNIKGTIAQLLNLVWFCRRTKIPFTVMAFSDVYGRATLHDRKSLKKHQTFKAGDISCHAFHLLEFFSSNMTVTEENDMMHYLWMMACRWGGYRDWNELGYPYQVLESLNMGGTPLNDAIIAMMDFVPQFKKDTGVQKVNTIFLTDGASNCLDGVFDLKLDTETGEHHEITDGTFRWNNRAKLIINDPVTNKTFETKGNVTDTLLKILKGRVYGMNVVGFFLAGQGRRGTVTARTLSYILNSWDDDVKEGLKKLKKDKFLAITSKGYDEYYILPGGEQLTPENETLDDDLVGASKAKLKTAFGKMSKGKVSSRQLLNKFVSMVA